MSKKEWNYFVDKGVRIDVKYASSDTLIYLLDLITEELALRISAEAEEDNKDD